MALHLIHSIELQREIPQRLRETGLTWQFGVVQVPESGVGHPLGQVILKTNCFRGLLPGEPSMDRFGGCL